MPEVIQAIGTVGFPIVCCLIMIYRDIKREETMLLRDTEVQKKHDENLTELRKVVTENTLATNNLVTLITHFLEKGDSDNG